MFNITSNENYNNIKDNSGILRTGLDLYKKDSAKKDMSVFVDESDISSVAMELFHRDEDIKKFTSMVLDDLDNPEDAALAQKTISDITSVSNDELANFLLSNEKFKNDLLG